MSCDNDSTTLLFTILDLQGFHDLCAVFQIVMGSKEQALPCIERVVRSTIRDFLRPTLADAVRYLNALFPLVAVVDSELYAHIERCVCAI